MIAKKGFSPFKLIFFNQFDTFHDIFLRSGAVPLDAFEEHIDAWIASEKGTTH